jgi:hypothetical protein
LTSLSNESAAALAAHAGGRLTLGSLTTLSDEAAAAFARHKGELYLRGLTSLSDAAASALAAHEGDLFVDLDNLPESAARILANQ